MKQVRRRLKLIKYKFLVRWYTLELDILLEEINETGERDVDILEVKRFKTIIEAYKKKIKDVEKS